MDEARDQREKRKRQNRDAQRRFRNRKKINDTAFLDPGQMESNPESTTNGLPMVPTTTWNLLGTLSTATQKEYHSFTGGLDLSAIHSCDTSEDAFLDASRPSFQKAGPEPLSAVLTQSEDIPLDNGREDHESHDHQLDQAVFNDMQAAKFPSNTSYVFPSNGGLASPVSTRGTTGTPDNTYPGPEAAPMSIISSHSMVNGTASRYVNQSSQGSSLHRTTSSSEFKMRQIYRSPKQEAIGIDNNRNNLGCCVAHKAETMISDVQKLCKFGIRYGLLAAEDNEVQDCLGLLRRKFHEMSKCPSRDGFYSSSSDSDAD